MAISCTLDLTYNPKIAFFYNCCIFLRQFLQKLRLSQNDPQKQHNRPNNYIFIKKYRYFVIFTLTFFSISFMILQLFYIFEKQILLLYNQVSILPNFYKFLCKDIGLPYSNTIVIDYI